MLDKNDLLNIRLMVREEVQHESQKLYDKLHEEIMLTRIELGRRINLFEENVDLRFTAIEKRLDSLEKSQDSLKQSVRSLEKDMRIVKRKLNRVAKDMEVIARHFEKGRIELNQRVEKVEHHLAV